MLACPNFISGRRVLAAIRISPIDELAKVVCITPSVREGWFAVYTSEQIGDDGKGGIVWRHPTGISFMDWPDALTELVTRAVAGVISDA